jgi:hypothetical protein
MFNDLDHPNVTLSEWAAFKASETARQSFVTQIVDRRDCGIFPDWFVPLARGAAIASPALLSEAGYRKGMRRPRDWRTSDGDCYWLNVGYTQGADSLDRLIVRECEGHEWWVIERRIADIDQVLVCSFGSTLILTPSHISAIRLAQHCNVKNPPHGLRWINQAPDDCAAAIELAQRRHVDELFGANSVDPEGSHKAS